MLTPTPIPARPSARQNPTLEDTLRQGALGRQVRRIGQLIHAPVPDHGLITALEPFLIDTRPVIYDLPVAVAELRWLAGLALHSVRAALGSPEPVVLYAVPAPLTGERIVELAVDHGIDPAGRFVTDLYLELRDGGRLPRRSGPVDELWT